MMSTILSAVCPLEAAVIVSTESLYLLARQRQRKKGRTQVRGFQRFVSICSYARSTITAGYEWEQTRSNGLANRNPTPQKEDNFNPLKPELNPICYLLALLGAHHFLHVSRIRVKLLTLR